MKEVWKESFSSVVSRFEVKSPLSCCSTERVCTRESNKTRITPIMKQISCQDVAFTKALKLEINERFQGENVCANVSHRFSQAFDPWHFK